MSNPDGSQGAGGELLLRLKIELNHTTYSQSWRKEKTRLKVLCPVRPALERLQLNGAAHCGDTSRQVLFTVCEKAFKRLSRENG